MSRPIRLIVENGRPLKGARAAAMRAKIVGRVVGLLAPAFEETKRITADLAPIAPARPRRSRRRSR